MSSLTKIATRARVEFFIFSKGQERDYILSLCKNCKEEHCNECPETVPGRVECDSCYGVGLIAFMMDNPSDGGESYKVITECGRCDGRGY